MDAGTGSIVLQAVVGALVGGLVAIKLFWNQVKTFFSRLLSRFEHQQVPQDQQHGSRLRRDG